MTKDDQRARAGCARPGTVCRWPTLPTRENPTEWRAVITEDPRVPATQVSLKHIWYPSVFNKMKG